MPNYNQTTFSNGEQYQRCRYISIDNPLNAIPSVVFMEEEIILIDNVVFLRKDLKQIAKQILDFYESYPIINPATDLPTGGTVTFAEMYTLLYSAYRYYASLRDFPIPEISIFAMGSKIQQNVINFTFLVFKKGNVENGNTIQWITTGSGANEATADDFNGTFPSGELSFQQGEFFKSITITVPVERIDINDKQFTLTLFNPAECIINEENQTAIGVIKDYPNEINMDYSYSGENLNVDQIEEAPSTNYIIMDSYSGEDTEIVNVE